MAKRLTEEMVIARTKISDLSKIKRLNCWGSELVDVSLLRKIPNVEVLSLSINKINSLADFQFCKRLEELYIRQNDIRDLNEVLYLQNLPSLKNLWLGENPCCNLDGYRLAVIRALPHLQKLDNVAITQDELRDSQRRGKNLCHPEDVQEEEPESDEEIIPGAPEHQYHRGQYSESEYYSAPRGSPPQQEQSPPRRQPEQRRSYSPEEYVERRRSSYERESPRQSQQYYEKTSVTNSFEEHNSSDHQTFNGREAKIVTSQSVSCIKEYTNGDKYIPYHAQHQRPESSDVSVQGQDRRYTCASAAHRPPFARRPATRNSSILSAVLCLVKELDYPSLEVLEMAVRCRMDELDE
ncbi:cilia- and flagella-associated protein 410-like isoform X2 [Anthonomus grandis grandis]|uniref:cilia- and flagella-associated protein 410-like isoform X2 n=1 Tax=Anthonomus grandis grandis TaxID=2921223 RepID=UPI0021658EC0|nr:cilia- and flagella-associated protein 410-like isoform X2 [Anthonomus grandis grandis]